jgi:hypothetical protein
VFDFRLRMELPKTPEEVAAHIVALAHLTDTRAHKDIFDHLYGNLSILDSKSSSLLTFNSIICTVYAIFMAGTPSRVDWILVHLGMALILASSFLLLSVVRVHWSTTEHLRHPPKQMVILLEVRSERTIRYRLAWNLSEASLLTLATCLVFRFFVRFPPAC